ncbi:MAG: hypothetical protein IJW32_04225 [Clostridia bacterium]|nr:hypothetical protein [Clostridia bacterium]
MSENKNNVSNFSKILLFSESQDYPFHNSSAFRDYDLVIRLYHYDDVTFKLKFKDENRMKKFFKSLHYDGFTLTTNVLDIEFKSDTDTSKSPPVLQLSCDSTDYEGLRPEDLTELYYIFSKQFKKQVKGLISTKQDEPIWHDDIGETYYFKK